MAFFRGITRVTSVLTVRPLGCHTMMRSGKMPESPIQSLVASRRLHATTQHLKPAVANSAIAPESYPTNHQPIESPANTQNFLDNQFVDSKASTWIDLCDPATNNLVTRVPQSTDEELCAAVKSAKKAFPAWRATSLLHKQQIMFKFVALIREHWDRLAASITLEQGKTFSDAKGDVLRGLQVAETACGITTQLTGEVLEVAKDMETRSYKEPLGVVAAICPFSKCHRPCQLALCSSTPCRLPCHDSIVVHAHSYHYRKYTHSQAV